MNDLISRKAAIKAIDDLPNCYNGYSDTYDKAYIIGTLEELPPIDPKKGKWILKDERWHCSECDDVAPKGIRWNFCPNCGAKMEGSEE